MLSAPVTPSKDGENNDWRTVEEATDLISVLRYPAPPEPQRYWVVPRGRASRLYLTLPKITQPNLTELSHLTGPHLS